MKIEVIEDEFQRKPERKQPIKEIEPYKKEEDLTYKLNEYEREFVSACNRSHPLIGGLIWFNLIVAHIRKMGIINVMPTGMGKSTSTRAIQKNVRDINFIRVDGSYTPARVKRDEMEKELEKAIIVIDDAETMCETTTAMETFIFLAQLMESGMFKGYSLALPTIQKADIGILANSTYNAIGRFIKEGIFHSHIKERFIRFYYMYYKQLTDKDGLPLTKTYLPEFNFVYKELKPLANKVSTDLLKKCIEMFETQFTINRANNYVNYLLNSHANLCNKECIDDDDAMWLLLHKPFITLEQNFMVRPVINVDGIPIAYGSLFGNVYGEILSWISYRPCNVELLRNRTSIGRETLSKVLRQLKEANYIEENRGGIYNLSGTFKEDIEKYHNIFGVGSVV